MYGSMTPNEPLIQAIGPEDLFTAANDGSYISMKDYRAMEVHIFTGDLCAGTSVVTMEQATDIAATAEKALNFTKHFMTGQRIRIKNQTGTFQVAETVRDPSTTDTAVIRKISRDHLIVTFAGGGTTWVDGETLTGQTSGATATVVGTGEYEDMLVEMPAVVNTFTTIAATFKHYMIPIDSSMLDKDNGFDCCHVKMAKGSLADTIACAVYLMKDPVHRIYPQRSAIGNVKIV